MRRSSEGVQSHFNPRSPHGERRKLLRKQSKHLLISIHAPRMGSDTTSVATKISTQIFQSTLPAWGATQLLNGSRFESFISIHAPRMGSDRPAIIFGGGRKNFNPRSPHGERQSM